VAFAAGASAPKVGDVVRKLQTRYEATKDFTADFTQAVEAATLGKTLESSGQVFFKRPGRMRWEFLEPEKQTIVADGQTLWVYQPDHHQVLRTPFRAAFQSATPVSFLLGVGELSKEFDPSLVTSPGADVIRLKLVPKQEREIGVLVLDVDPRTYDIAAAEVTDPLGNVTRLKFSNLKRDVGLTDSNFTFKTPPGTDVVEPPASP
jgi:outer membrane lipoprotein carrier protein